MANHGEEYSIFLILRSPLILSGGALDLRILPLDYTSRSFRSKVGGGGVTLLSDAAPLQFVYNFDQPAATSQAKVIPLSRPPSDLRPKVGTLDVPPLRLTLDLLLRAPE